MRRRCVRKSSAGGNSLGGAGRWDHGTLGMVLGIGDGIDIQEAQCDRAERTNWEEKMTGALRWTSRKRLCTEVLFGSVPRWADSGSSRCTAHRRRRTAGRRKHLFCKDETCAATSWKLVGVSELSQDVKVSSQEHVYIYIYVM